VTWLTHVCDMTHSRVWHDSLTCVTWLTHVCDMTHSHVWHDSLTCVTWLTHMCDMTHSHVWHDSPEAIPTCWDVCVYVCVCACERVCMCVLMGGIQWHRVVGSFKFLRWLLQISRWAPSTSRPFVQKSPTILASFAEEPYTTGFFCKRALNK